MALGVCPHCKKNDNLGVVREDLPDGSRKVDVWTNTRRDRQSLWTVIKMGRFCTSSCPIVECRACSLHFPMLRAETLSSLPLSVQDRAYPCRCALDCRDSCLMLM